MSRMKQVSVVLAAFTMVGALAVVNLSASGASTKTIAKPLAALGAPGSQWTKKHPFKAGVHLRRSTERRGLDPRP